MRKTKVSDMTSIATPVTVRHPDGSAVRLSWTNSQAVRDWLRSFGIDSDFTVVQPTDHTLGTFEFTAGTSFARLGYWVIVHVHPRTNDYTVAVMRDDDYHSYWSELVTEAKPEPDVRGGGVRFPSHSGTELSGA